MKTITFYRVIITFACVALILCVLFGKTVIGGIASYGYLDSATGVITLICSPVCIVLVWLRKSLFSYIAALIIAVPGLCELVSSAIQISKNNWPFSVLFQDFYDCVFIFLPLGTCIICVYLALKIAATHAAVNPQN